MRAELHRDGGSGRALLYVPGIDGTGELLLCTAERLRESWRLLQIRYVPEGPDEYERLADGVLEVLDGAGLDDALVVTESFGGGVALHCALRAPQRIRGLMIVNSFCHYRRRTKLALTRLFAPLVQGPIFHLGRRYFGGLALLGPDAGPEERREFHQHRGTRMDAAYRRRFAMLAQLDLRPELQRLTMPVQLIASERDRVVDSVPSAEVMRALLPDVQLQTLPRGGHVVLPNPAYPWATWLEELERRAGATGGPE